jgi:hypothetical protein
MATHLRAIARHWLARHRYPLEPGVLVDFFLDTYRAGCPMPDAPHNGTHVLVRIGSRHLIMWWEGDTWASEHEHHVEGGDMRWWPLP